ncbi:MAG: HDOD domain-containing protein [Desulfobacterales bacterium]|jgi:putative nucleotidyltransferase with HDIG domain|nr:HDOD domain-containing protein [Desulfobacterales bacterium]
MQLSEDARRIKNDIKEKIMAEVSTFPSMPRAGVKLRALLNEKDVQIAQIEQILRHDPGLTTNVLRLANSAYFGVPAKVGSLKQAIMLVGIKRFAQIAVSASMSKTMDKTVEGYGLRPGELWLHSIAASNTAEALTKNKKFAETNDVFTPALLHDMGKLVLGKFAKEEFQKIESIVAKGVPLVRAENMVFGTDHAEVGAQILTKWSFPDDIVNAVRWHHNAERIKDSNMQSAIVYLSNIMCQSNGDGNSTGGQYAMPAAVVLKRLGIKIDQYEVLAGQAHSWMNKLSDTLSFE